MERYRGKSIDTIFPLPTSHISIASLPHSHLRDLKDALGMAGPVIRLLKTSRIPSDHLKAYSFDSQRFTKKEPLNQKRYMLISYFVNIEKGSFKKHSLVTQEPSENKII